jgi:hypothetical protein
MMQESFNFDANHSGQRGIHSEDRKKRVGGQKDTAREHLEDRKVTVGN